MRHVVIQNAGKQYAILSIIIKNGNGNPTRNLLLACFDLLLLVDYIPPLGCKYVRTAVEQQQVLASSYLI